MSQKTLLSIIELGGYPDFSPVYQAAGYRVIVEYSMRKAIRSIKSCQPAVIVAEFNFQSDFRDRSSSLESIMASMQRIGDCQIVVFYEKEHELAFQRFARQHPVAAALAFPVDEDELARVFQGL